MSVVETKAYIARLPLLREVQSAQLRRWAKGNCWRSALSDDETHTTWVAIREKKRTQGAWSRHVKEILKALGVCPPSSRNWLTLCTVQQAEEIMEQPQSDKNSGAEERVIPLRTGVAKGRRPATVSTTFEIVRG